MKRLIILIISLLLITGFYGCGTKADDNDWQLADTNYPQSDLVWMETEYEVYPVGTTSVRAKWYNSGDIELTGGTPFELQKLVGGKWRVVEKEPDAEHLFTMVGYSLLPGGDYWQEYNLISYTNGLDSGKYRISAYLIKEHPNCIQVYGEFSVNKTMVKRDITMFEDGMFEYVSDYGFVLTLPESWEGLTVNIESSTGDDRIDKLAKKIDKDFFALCIRHPKWTQEEPYQDIIFAVVGGDEWNRDVYEVVDGDFESVPEFISTDKHIFMKVVSSLDPSLCEYDDVVIALKSMTIVR
jgi:hypothetical protein